MKQEKSMAEQLIVCGKPYRILRLLGHGKGGYDLDITDQRLHHEIYLSDARKVAPEKLKTVIRHPIKER